MLDPEFVFDLQHHAYALQAAADVLLALHKVVLDGVLDRGYIPDVAVELVHLVEVTLFEPPVLLDAF